MINNIRLKKLKYHMIINGVHKINHKLQIIKMNHCKMIRILYKIMFIK